MITTTTPDHRHICVRQRVMADQFTLIRGRETNNAAIWASGLLLSSCHSCLPGPLKPEFPSDSHQRVNQGALLILNGGDKRSLTVPALCKRCDDPPPASRLRWRWGAACRTGRDVVPRRGLLLTRSCVKEFATAALRRILAHFPRHASGSVSLSRLCYKNRPLVGPASRPTPTATTRRRKALPKPWSSLEATSWRCSWAAFTRLSGFRRKAGRTVMENLTAFLRARERTQRAEADRRARAAPWARRGESRIGCEKRAERQMDAVAEEVWRAARQPEGFRERPPATDIAAVLTVIEAAAARRSAHGRSKHQRVLDFRQAVLRRADLTRARLEGADLTFAHLEEAPSASGPSLLRFSKAPEYQGAYLERMSLEGANLWGAHLEGALLSRGRIFNASSAWHVSRGRQPTAACSTAPTSPLRRLEYADLERDAVPGQPKGGGSMRRRATRRPSGGADPPNALDHAGRRRSGACALVRPDLP